jgi:hypothetical protein
MNQISIPYMKTAGRLGNMLWPVAAIGGLIVLWVLIVIVCMSIAPLLGAVIGGNVPL